jgi:hypothetical protein
MKFDKILTVAKKFERFARDARRKKMAQQELSDEAITQVVVSTYKELGVTPPDDVRIQYQETGDQPSHHAQPKHYNVIIWANSYLEPSADSTMQSRLHGAFDPNDELYNFYVKFFNDDEG